MKEKVHQLGVTLSPHVKTCKSIAVLRMLAGGEDGPITVSTLAEARYFFDSGGHGTSSTRSASRR